MPEENSSTNGEENVLVEVINVDQPWCAAGAAGTAGTADTAVASCGHGCVTSLGGHGGVDGLR